MKGGDFLIEIDGLNDYIFFLVSGRTSYRVVLNTVSNFNPLADDGDNISELKSVSFNFLSELFKLVFFIDMFIMFLGDDTSVESFSFFLSF